ncbi:putative bifunctional diguanylate cyclase/phosphodiesterase [Neobacillus drentensis]|uniref:putative bifunctional diguanylate cyclase/phosphodiesterase n=1 Tax=Neobacillus drentensis TaxID=220684 RepID=UPI000824E073|nr:bifunctional diguanylate cyclase/phosphodiesterase [Neobacillus drentensis]
MDGKSTEREGNHDVEVSSIQLLNERLDLTLAFSKRYQMSSAVGYLRIFLPLELSHPKDNDTETILLNKISARLHGSLRDIDTVIKVNSRDFMIIIADITEHDCQIICERIIHSISAPYPNDFHYFSINSSMGICMYPYGSEERDELKTMAKIQMYDALELGENRCSFYKGDLNQTAYRKVIIENDLPYALKKGQLYVHYQPQYCLKKRAIVGAEALIRWNHPSLGEIFPGEFISYAEDAGMLTGLFFWVFEEVCKKMACVKGRCLKYSINLSVNQLLLDSLILDISNILKRYSIPAAQITLEITENIEIYTVKKVNEKLHLLKEMGFTIALDDFGNGYFSFSDFIKLPIDFIKLDRDFVFSLLKNKKHKGVITPIIQMAHNLELKVIIEGIEDHTQFTEWVKLDCDLIQGYFISEPISFEELTESIAEIETRVAGDFSVNELQ